MIRVLFIGGVADGDRLEVPDDATAWRVLRQLQPVSSRASELLTLVRTPGDTYTRRLLPGQTQLSVFVQDSVPFPAMIDRLVQQYTRQEAADDL